MASFAGAGAADWRASTSASDMASMNAWRAAKLREWNDAPQGKLRRRFPNRASLDAWMDRQCARAAARKRSNKSKGAGGKGGAGASGESSSKGKCCGTAGAATAGAATTGPGDAPPGPLTVELMGTVRFDEEYRGPSPPTSAAAGAGGNASGGLTRSGSSAALAARLAAAGRFAGAAQRYAFVLDAYRLRAYDDHAWAARTSPPAAACRDADADGAAGTDPARAHSPRGLYDPRCTNLGLVCEFLAFCRLLHARGLVPGDGAGAAGAAEAAEPGGEEAGADAWSWDAFLAAAADLLPTRLDAAGARARHGADGDGSEQLFELAAAAYGGPPGGASPAPVRRLRGELRACFTYYSCFDARGVLGGCGSIGTAVFENHGQLFAGVGGARAWKALFARVNVLREDTITIRSPAAGHRKSAKLATHRGAGGGAEEEDVAAAADDDDWIFLDMPST